MCILFAIFSELYLREYVGVTPFWGEVLDLGEGYDCVLVHGEYSFALLYLNKSKQGITLLVRD